MLFRLRFGFFCLSAAASFARPAWAQTQTPVPPPSSSAQPPPAPPPSSAQPPPSYPPPAGYQQPAPGYQPAAPASNYQQPTYQQPPPGYQQPPPGYQQPPPGYQPAPPGYQPAPPGYQPYGQPGYSYYPPPPLPPPPKRNELSWSFRFNLFDLLFGRATAEVEYALAGPLSITVAPSYIFGDPHQDRDLSITANGAGLYGELGVWVEGRPLRGYFLKGHFEHDWITFHGYNQDVAAPATKLGVMFGSQSIYGGWFTLSGGFGVAFDTQSQERSIMARDTGTGAIGVVTIPASGLFGNGWDLLSQIGLGGSF